eukprot:364262-Chlamydomonas_euryale.AAC.22
MCVFKKCSALSLHIGTRLFGTPVIICSYIVAMPPRATTAATAAGSAGNAFPNNVDGNLMQRHPCVEREPAALLAELELLSAFAMWRH